VQRYVKQIQSKVHVAEKVHVSKTSLQTKLTWLEHKRHVITRKTWTQSVARRIAKEIKGKLPYHNWRQDDVTVLVRSGNRDGGTNDRRRVVVDRRRGLRRLETQLSRTTVGGLSVHAPTDWLVSRLVTPAHGCSAYTSPPDQLSRTRSTLAKSISTKPTRLQPKSLRPKSPIHNTG